MKSPRVLKRERRAQTVPGTTHSYVVHITTVAAEVIAALEVESFAQPDLAVACALLHDVVEDTAIGLRAIEQEFGPAVAAGVDALTKRESVAKESRMQDSLDRIRQQPHEVWLVKLADRIANLQPPPSHWSADKCRRYRDEAETILAALGEASAALSTRFRERLESYRQYAM